MVDDSSVRSRVAALLQRDGFETTAIEHGPPAVEAIEGAASGHFAAIVVQVNVTCSRSTSTSSSWRSARP